MKEALTPIRFDVNRHPRRKERRVAETLASIEDVREGNKHVYFNYHHSQIMPVKACPICKVPAPLSQSMQFCCRHCLILFS